MSQATTGTVKKRAKILPRIIAIFPFMSLVIMVTTLAVPVPLLDEWELVPDIEKQIKGELTASDLWAQSNDHRIFFPKLILLTLGRLTHWDIRYELAMNIVFAVGIFASIVWLIRRTSQRLNMGLDWAIPISAVTVFSMNQYPNWLWGWQIQMFLNMLAVILGLILLTNFSWKNFAIAAVLGFVATHSFANGILFWPIAFVLLVIKTDKQRRTAPLGLWFILSSLACWSFFYGYHRTADSVPISNPFTQPLTYIQSVGSFLGCGFSTLDRHLALALGLAAPGIVAWLSVRIIRANREYFPVIAPFLAFSAYAIGSALLFGFTSTQTSAGQSFISRYATIAVPLWVSIVVLLFIWMNLPKVVERDTASSIRPPRVCLTVLVVVLWMSSMWAVPQAHLMSQSMAEGLKGVLDVDFSNPAREHLRRIGILHPDTLKIVARCRLLSENRLSVFRK